MPSVAGRPLDTSEKQILFEKIHARESELKSLRALYSFEVSEKGKKNRLRQAIIFEKPESLRLETFPETSFLSLQLTVLRGQIGSFIDSSAHQAYLANNTEKLLSRFYKLPLAPGDLMGLLSGRTPEKEIERMRWGEEYEVRLDDKAGRFLISRNDGNFIWVLRKDSLLLEEAIYRNIFDDSVILHAKMDDIRYVDTIPLPHKVSFYLAADDIALELTAQTFKVNRDISPLLFEVQIPEDFSIENLREEDA